MEISELQYGIEEAERQWMIISEDLMLTEGGLDHVFGITQLLLKISQNGSMIILVEKLTDELLGAGYRTSSNNSLLRLKRALKMG